MLFGFGPLSREVPLVGLLDQLVGVCGPLPPAHLVTHHALIAAYIGRNVI